MLTDAEKAALERAAARLSLALRKSNVPRGIADLATLRGLIERAGWHGMLAHVSTDVPAGEVHFRHADGRVDKLVNMSAPPTDVKGDV